MTIASTQRSILRATSATGSRLPSAASGCSDDDVTAELVHRDFECRPRPQRRFFEQHRHVPAVERVGSRRLPAERSIRLHLRGKIQTALDIRGIEVEHREKILRGAVANGHGFLHV